MSHEPWRYRCPNCESTSIHKRRNYGDAGFQGTEPQAPYYCQYCNSPFFEPVDMKERSKPEVPA